MQKATTLYEKPCKKYLFTSFYFVRLRDFLKSLLPLANNFGNICPRNLKKWCNFVKKYPTQMVSLRMSKYLHHEFKGPNLYIRPLLKPHNTYNKPFFETAYYINNWHKSKSAQNFEIFKPTKSKILPNLGQIL